jgi:hypothetical protein
VLVRCRCATQTARSAASKMSIAGGGEVLFQKV